eukprot:287675_1
MLDITFLVFIVLCSICALACIILLVLLLINMKRQPDVIEQSSILYYSIGSIVCFILRILTQIPQEVYNVQSVSAWTVSHQVYFCVGHITWHVAQAFTYLLFMNRIYYAFKGTQYQYRPYVYALLYIGIILFLLGGVFLLIIYALHRYQVMTYELLDRLHIICAVSKSLIDLILTMSMVKLFTSKMFEIYVDVYNHERSHRGSFQSKVLIDFTTQINLLAIIAFISTQILCITVAIYCLMNIFNSSNHSTHFEPYAVHNQLTYLMCFNAVINVFCVYLALPYDENRALYERLCHGCHSLSLVTAKRCIKKKQKQIENVYYIL